MIVTHFYDLYYKCKNNKLNVCSLVMECKDNENSNNHMQRTYKLIQAEPNGKSFADDIASELGFTTEKICTILKNNGYIENDDINMITKLANYR